MQMAFTFVTDWILVGKILVGYKIWFCLIQNCFGGIFDWLRFLHSCVLTVNGRFENPVTSGFCHPSISAFEICFGSKKNFSLVQDTFAPLFFPVGKEGIAISSVKFSFFDLCFFFCVISVWFLPVFPDFSFRYRMTIWNFKLGSVYFVFVWFILLGLGWGGWLAGRTHSFRLKFSWDRTSSWDSHPYHTWRLKGLPLHFFLAGTGAGLLAIYILLRRMFALDLCERSFPLDPSPLIPISCLLLTSGRSCLNSSAQPLDRTSWMYFR